MQIHVREQVKRIVIVAPQERVDAFSVPALRERLDQLLAGGAAHFVIDLGAVPFMDSAGCAALVSALKRARAAGGDVRLVWPQAEGAQRILRLTKFDRVFTIADSVDAALKGF